MRHGPLILLPAFVFAMVACSGSDDATTGTDAPSSEMATTATTTIATTSVPETMASEPGAVEVFSFADDDLCEWVTQEELTGFITEAFDWNGSAVQTPPDSPSAKCEWRLIGDDVREPNSVFAFDATGSEFEGTEAEPVDFAALDVVDFSDHTPVEGDVVAVSGHPDLSDGVVAYDYGWGMYVFWVPPRDDYLGLSLPLLNGASEVWADAAYFEVADQILHELGWVG